jgi:tripartite-type tricarboxylate transporter receptor subunit TctC
VYDQSADGYTLLMGAENPALYTALGIIEVTYDDFEPVFLIGDETVGIVVSKDSKYTSFTEIIEDALANPGEITLSTTGVGGLPWEVGSFITAVTGATFSQIPYDSDATAKTAVLGGECDFTVCKVQSGIEDYKAGTLNFLCMFADEEVSELPEIPLITAEYPDFAQYMPWGPFYGIFVKTGTDQAIIDTLAAAFEEAYKDATYQTQLETSNINPLGLTGADATAYLKDWQLNTIDALYKSGAIDKTAADLGLE